MGWGSASSLVLLAIGLEGMASSCVRRYSGWTLENISLRERSGVRMAAEGDHLPWRCSTEAVDVVLRDMVFEKY